MNNSTQNQIDAIVEEAPKTVRLKKSGEQRIVVKLQVLGDGNAKMWGEPDDANLKNLKQGQYLKVEKSGKSYKLISADPLSLKEAVTAAPAPVQITAPPTSAIPEQMKTIRERKVQLMQVVKDEAKFMCFCLEAAREATEQHNLNDQALATLAAALFKNRVENL
ncbi:MAG: hypothetical protein AAGI23_08235 [Bacteroidota bacterium]